MTHGLGEREAVTLGAPDAAGATPVAAQAARAGCQNRYDYRSVDPRFRGTCRDALEGLGDALEGAAMSQALFVHTSRVPRARARARCSVRIVRMCGVCRQLLLGPCTAVYGSRTARTHVGRTHPDELATQKARNSVPCRPRAKACHSTTDIRPLPGSRKALAGSPTSMASVFTCLSRGCCRRRAPRPGR